LTFSPKLVALDIDGTLLVNSPDTGQVEERITEPVVAAVNRAYDAGAHIVLATGRSTFGITRIWELLGLPRNGERTISVASNGSVTFRYPPVEVRSTETFDARKIVLMLLEEVPNAAVAVEEVGVGYRLNRPFPDGEISGEMVLQSVEELVAEPVTRVIIRDPHSSEEEFLALAEKLGLQGTNYFIGWTAWLDIAPEGISKASALADIAAELGVDQADVLAIGDGRNDSEMLQWAGRGVAMGQSPLEVQEAADDVTETVANDGVAFELSRWFPVVEAPDRATGDVVRRFVATLEARDWAAWAALLHEEVVYELPQTRERVRGRDTFLRFNQEFPGDWHLRAKRVVADGEHGVLWLGARVGDSGEGDAVAFLTVVDGLVTEVVEFWPEGYEPPPGREHLTERW
jgi:Cof subfamily protein (haloacid dehalogenase superfamily)